MMTWNFRQVKVFSGESWFIWGKLHSINPRLKTKKLSPVSTVFAHSPEDQGSIPCQVIPKLKKWYLIPPRLALSIIKYRSRIRGAI